MVEGCVCTYSLILGHLMVIISLVMYTLQHSLGCFYAFSSFHRFLLLLPPPPFYYSCSVCCPPLPPLPPSVCYEIERWIGVVGVQRSV